MTTIYDDFISFLELILEKIILKPIKLLLENIYSDGSYNSGFIAFLALLIAVSFPIIKLIGNVFKHKKEKRISDSIIKYKNNITRIYYLRSKYNVWKDTSLYNFDYIYSNYFPTDSNCMINIKELIQHIYSINLKLDFDKMDMDVYDNIDIKSRPFLYEYRITYIAELIGLSEYNETEDKFQLSINYAEKMEEFNNYVGYIVDYTSLRKGIYNLQKMISIQTKHFTKEIIIYEEQNEKLMSYIKKNPQYEKVHLFLDSITGKAKNGEAV